jgi:hypothetical protein
MSDEELDVKFRDQAERILPPGKAEHLRCLLRRLDTQPDVGRVLRTALEGEPGDC